MTWYTATVSDPNALSFSDPASIPDTALSSFHPLVFLYFILSFVLIPYPLYRVISTKYNWGMHIKSIARHWSDMMLGITYGLIVFVFGNYTKTYSWITVVAFYPSLFGYALIAEIPFTKYSLPNIRSWPKGMWMVILIALGLILTFAAIHVYLASQLIQPFVVYYTCSLLLPFFLLFISVLLAKEVNSNWFRTALYNYHQKNRPDQKENEATQDNETTSNRKLDNRNQRATLKSPYSNTVHIHIHHWQIFYVLSFFTRFNHPVSQVASGIVLACYMHGICAYGYDPLINDH